MTKIENANKWKKENFKIFKADLPKDEVLEYNKILKEKNMTKPEFIRWAFEKLKKDKKM